jgi:PPOX class probable F420-dependent enzyme
MESFGKPEMLAYMRGHKLAVVATIGADGGPQSALVGVGVTHALQVVFDTVSTSRKHANLQRDPRIAVTFSGPAEQTLQYEGVAFPVSVAGAEDQAYRQAYYESWPDGRQRLQWPNLVYWRIVPRWARYSDYDRGPLIVEFDWN